MVYVIKAPVHDANADVFTFENVKTMYGGKKIAVGNLVYIIDSENEGGRGLVARGVVEWMEATPLKKNVKRQTPRLSIRVRNTGHAMRSLGRDDLKPFTNWDDGKPQTELNFKFYRQATNKIVGITDAAADFLAAYFQ